MTFSTDTHHPTTDLSSVVSRHQFLKEATSFCLVWPPIRALCVEGLLGRKSVVAHITILNEGMGSTSSSPKMQEFVENEVKQSDVSLSFATANERLIFVGGKV